MGRTALRVLPAALLVLVGAAGAVAGAALPTLPPRGEPTLAGLAVPVASGENRAVVFTNKRSAYYYTQTHRNTHVEHAAFRGYHVAGRTIFSDYRLRVNGIERDPSVAQAMVFPDALVREYPDGVTETLRLFDDRDLVEVAVTGAAGAVRLELAGERLRVDGSESGIDWYLVGSADAARRVDHVAVGRRQGRFLIAVAASRGAATALLAAGFRDGERWQVARQARLAALLNGEHFLAADDPARTEALRWIALTTDALVTRQRGTGIYAGLPWFDEYWGRDTFISLAGATLVTGQFETARRILTSFARFQDLDPRSRDYGRVPNIVKPESLDYHTTDGTPRFVIALRDYVRYSGDRRLIRALYPNVAASIEGALAHWTDAAGYLLHQDNETWMDARRSSDLVSYSPRGTRADDIQALWYEQLRAGAEFASATGHAAAARRWSAAADRVRDAFARDFVEPGGTRIADRLTADGRPDYTLRPNLLFALPLVRDPAVSATALRRSWESLVFPWGVATLDPRDPNFHPYHWAPERYPKDEAYHNGTVWPWLDGIAIERMIEAGQVELAWPLFEYLNRLALTRGVVGGLPETSDAYPHPGEAWPRLTGTFLQAWSNAEHLRVWYQDLLGVRPDLVHGAVTLAPRLPAAVGTIDFSVRLGAGSLRAVFDRPDGNRRYVYRLAGRAATLMLDLPPYPVTAFAAAANDTLVAQADDAGLAVQLWSSTGVPAATVHLAPSPERQRAQELRDAAFSGARFASPDPSGGIP